MWVGWLESKSRKVFLIFLSVSSDEVGKRTVETRKALTLLLASQLPKSLAGPVDNPPLSVPIACDYRPAPIRIAGELSRSSGRLQ